ncbi:cysteine desulfurase [Edaphobacter aggregans]|uniref:cysteine desulfurase n=1 Tax=Edaphobacter aggregans TaxID=570835 RepID=A0A428MH50_9BACT|nr:cysteine desulfurase family protein [Edaphobacter aggregans]RSL16059.1 cysteine desulfurase [Edaphobacter aggregans]
MQRIYMDANATTPLLPEVYEAMRPFWIEHFGNASSIHQHGQHARAAVDHARDAIARLFHCRASEIVFTSGGTESDNLALFGTLTSELSPTKEKTHVITTSIEHHAILHAAESLEHRNIDVTFLPCTAQGIIEPAELIGAIRPNTKLVSVMFANNETGVVQPIAALAAIAHAAGALFHTDAVQAAGKLPLDLGPHGPLKDVDLLTISGHKMHAPKGIGILFVRRNVRLNPMMHGGSHERQRRAGTENVAGIVGLGKAAEIAQQWLATEGPAKLAALRDRLEQGILAQVPEAGVNGGGAPRVANTTNIYFDHIEAEALVIALDLKGLSVSGGSACQSGATEPSHVLTAMGLSSNRARASIRFSLSKLTTEEEVDHALELIPTAVAHLRELSPTWQQHAVATEA